MKKAKNELLQFLAGLAMLVSGLFIFSQKVTVFSGFFGFGWRMGGFYMSNGLIIVPLIIGIVWMFATEGSFPSKVFTAASVLLIIVAIIMTTNITLTRMTLYEWVLLLVLIFGGAGMLARLLLAGPGKKDEAQNRELDRVDRELREKKRQLQAIEDELENIKRGK